MISLFEKVLAWLDSNWFALIVALYLIGMMLNGHRVGFLRLAVSAASGVISFVMARALLPTLTAFFSEHTQLQKALGDMFVKRLGIDSLGAEELRSLSSQALMIDDLRIPEALKEGLKLNNTEEIWRMVGADKFSSYIGDYLGNAVMNTVLYCALFLVIFTLLRILIRTLDIITRIPVIHGLNQIAGAALGLAEGLVIVWIFFMILSMFGTSGLARQLLQMISANVWLRFLYQYNVLAMILTKVLFTLH